MTRPRKELISVEETAFYHCCIKCVRHSCLCGEHELTGKNYDHRKQWAVTRLKQLASVFAIDVCAYAIMSNHYHAVLHINVAKAKSWKPEEVVKRWMDIFNGELLVDRWLSERDKLSEAELAATMNIIEKWRERLMSISWFMRCMNETIARQANAEDGCKGRFWEGRFKSQALLGEAALLTCMAYVDLNPIRAEIQKTPETSDFTSIQQRIYELAKQRAMKPAEYSALETRMRNQQRLLADIMEDLPQSEIVQAELMPFDATGRDSAAIPFSQRDYLELVDMTGRAIRPDKRGYIPASVAPILQRLGLDEEAWVHQITHFGRSFSDQVGSLEVLKGVARKIQKKWLKGTKAAGELFKARSEVKEWSPS